MLQPIGLTPLAMARGRTYLSRVIAAGAFAYYPLANDATEKIAGYDGSNSGTSFDGTKASFNGSASIALPSGFRSVVNTDTGAISCFVTVASGQWTDGTNRGVTQLWTNNGNYLSLGKGDLSNKSRAFYRSGSQSPTSSTTQGTDGITTRHHVAMRWNVPIDYLIYLYVNGSLVASFPPRNVWAGGTINQAHIGGTFSYGAGDPIVEFIGTIDRIAYWNTNISESVLLALAVE